MKKNIHPNNYRLVVFSDETTGFRFLTKSTASSNETIVWEDKKEYPVIKVHVSSSSHPYFTGEERIVDTEGRVDRFKARAAAAARIREERNKMASKKVLVKKSK
jgi:large subunit ribosomal protein L31